MENHESPKGPAGGGEGEGAASTSAPLAGRIVLITGGAHRVGGAISRHLGSLGAHVLVTYHSSAAAAEALVAELPAGGRAFHADLRQPDAADRLLSSCAEAGVLPDAVVHSAASFLRRRALDTTPEEWDEVFALNTRAFFLLARAFARHHGVGSDGRWEAGGGVSDHHRVAGEGGDTEEGLGGEVGATDLALVAIADAGALELWTDYAAHCVSKAALLPLVKLLARSLGPAVRVNAVLPGPVLPPPDSSRAEIRAMAERTLVKRLGQPLDVARSVAFLLESPFATGTLLEMTGGTHLWRGRLERDPQ